MASSAVKPRLYEKYKNEIAPALAAEFGHENKFAVPRLDRIVVSMGIKEAASDVKILDQAAIELAAITGQKPKVCRAKKYHRSVSKSRSAARGCMNFSTVS
jgi:large subunit ribosomal protein L5